MKVELTINGVLIRATKGLTLIEAAWESGVPSFISAGCLEGVCGSCRIMLRRNKEVTVNLACQVFAENGLDVVFLPSPATAIHRYKIGELKDDWDTEAQFHQIFPESSNGRHCHGCVTSCPKGIVVEDGVLLAASGHFRDAGEVFFECIMCELCDASCPDLIAPSHVGLFSRRVTAHFHLRPPNLIHRLEELRQEKLPTEREIND